MHFGILGPLEVRDHGRQLAIRGPKLRTLLAVLLLHANHPVSTSRLVELLWEGEPASNAPRILHVYVSQLRRLLDPLQRQRVKDELLVTCPPGYLLKAPPGRLDQHEFEWLAVEGRRALAGGDPHKAASSLRMALALWRGPALIDVDVDELERTVASRLEEERLQALQDRIEADLRCGWHAELVGELQALVDRYPLRERFHAQRMLTLYRSDRRADALAAYRELRGRLVQELGMEPCRALQELERQILANDPVLELEAGPCARIEVTKPPVARRQLPPDTTYSHCQW